MSPEEKEQFTKEAKEKGLSMSDYIMLKLHGYEVTKSSTYEGREKKFDF